MSTKQIQSTYIPEIHLLSAGSRSRMRVRSERPAGIDCWYLSYTIQGTVYVECGDTGFTAGRNELVLVKPGHPLLYHNTPARSSWSWIFAMFRPHPHWLPLLQWPEVFPGYMTLDLNGSVLQPVIRDLLKKILKEVHRGPSIRHELLAMNTLERLLLEVDPLWNHDMEKLPDPRLLQLERHVDVHLEEPLTVKQLAEVCGLSESRFAHWFCETSGVTPMQFVEDRRMERARNLLISTDEAMKVIGVKTGYPDPQHFTKRFRHVHGMTPGRFRKGAGQLEL